MKYAAMVVLYNPTPDEIANINYIALYYDKVYAYDNSASNLCESFTMETIEYIFNGENDGLSTAYNTVIERALSEGVHWLTLFDQDSEVTGELVQKIKNYTEKITDEKIAAVVPTIQYGDIPPVDQSEHTVEWAINSGETLNILCIQRSGVIFDENIFLDRVDRDFSKQLAVKGLKIIQIPNAVLKHHLGEQLNGHTVHSPVRNYYIFKNRFYYNYKYYTKVKATALTTFQTAKHVLSILYSRNDVMENIKMLDRAVKDYRQGKMGKIL